MFNVEVVKHPQFDNNTALVETVVRADMRSVAKIDEAKRGRAELEQALTALCVAYYEATGLPVSDICADNDTMGKRMVRVQVAL